MTITVDPGDTGCDLTLVHDGVPLEYAARAESGWRDLLERLGAIVHGTER